MLSVSISFTPVKGELAVVAPVIVYVTVKPSSAQLSAKMALLSSVASQVHVEASVHTTTSLLGQAIEGMSLSTTVMSNSQVVVLPQASVAVNKTVVVPIGKAVPDGNPLVNTTSTFSSQLSNAIG